VCYLKHMRLHISLDEGLIAELDRRAGRGRRSAFIARTLERALEDERRWDEIEAALGGIADHGHDWDADPAAWVHSGRRVEPERVG
jgi:metal-responsive CopG/Arc/MetJ family transcriptional regulator